MEGTLLNCRVHRVEIFDCRGRETFIITVLINNLRTVTSHCIDSEYSPTIRILNVYSAFISSPHSLYHYQNYFLYWRCRILRSESKVYNFTVFTNTISFPLTHDKTFRQSISPQLIC